MAVVGEAAVPLLATRARTDVGLHLDHLVERSALFVILVLGESVAGVAHGIATARWSASTLVVAALTFVLPLTLALGAVGSGVQLAVQQSMTGEAPLGTRVLLAGGVAGYLAAASLTNSGMSQRSRRGWWWPLRAAGIAVLDVAVELPPLAVVGALDVLLLLVVLLGSAERSADRLPVDPL